MDLYNGFNGLRHRINWTYFSVLDGLAHPLYSADQDNVVYLENMVNVGEAKDKLEKYLKSKGII